MTVFQTSIKMLKKAYQVKDLKIKAISKNC